MLKKLLSNSFLLDGQDEKSLFIKRLRLKVLLQQSIFTIARDFNPYWGYYKFYYMTFTN